MMTCNDNYDLPVSHVFLLALFPPVRRIIQFSSFYKLLYQIATLGQMYVFKKIKTSNNDAPFQENKAGTAGLQTQEAMEINLRPPIRFRMLMLLLRSCNATPSFQAPQWL